MSKQKLSYPQKASRTLSKEWFGKNLHSSYVLLTLAQAIAALQNLDKVKKQLYYGRDVGDVDYSDTAISRMHGDQSADQFAKTPEARDLLHAVIGKATEAGELLENVFELIKEDKTIDITKVDIPNIVEEVGDGFWYDAILCNLFDFSFEDAQEVNIDKLQSEFGRFAHGFSCEKANERNLEAEREILELRTKNA